MSAEIRITLPPLTIETLHALQARARAMGSGTDIYAVCTSVAELLRDRIPEQPSHPERNGK